MSVFVVGVGVDVMMLLFLYELLLVDEVFFGDLMIVVYEFGDFGGVGIGVWEMIFGIVIDIEVDEVFVVLFGWVCIDFMFFVFFLFEVGFGYVVCFVVGMCIIWIVIEILCKIYFIFLF